MQEDFTFQRVQISNDFMQFQLMWILHLELYADFKTFFIKNQQPVQLFVKNNVRYFIQLDQMELMLIGLSIFNEN
jgi:hypothetical protein